MIWVWLIVGSVLSSSVVSGKKRTHTGLRETSTIHSIDIATAPVICPQQVTAHLKNKPRDLGPIRVEREYGQLSPKYQPLTTSDIEASDNLDYFLEKFRNFFKTGLGEIPPLDPYYNPKTTTTLIDDDDIQGSIHFSQFYLTGAQQFILNNIEVRLGSQRVDYSLDFPKLHIYVNFNTDVKVDELRNVIFGFTNITLNNVRLKGAFELQSLPPGNNTQDQKLSVTAFKYNFTTTNAQYNLRDRNWLEEDFLQSVRRRTKRSIKDSSSTLIKAVALAVADKVSYSFAVATLNQLDTTLSYYTKAQILAMLLPDFKTYKD